MKYKQTVGWDEVVYETQQVYWFIDAGLRQEIPKPTWHTKGMASLNL